MFDRFSGLPAGTLASLHRADAMKVSVKPGHARPELCQYTRLDSSQGVIQFAGVPPWCRSIDLFQVIADPLWERPVLPLLRFCRVDERGPGAI